MARHAPFTQHEAVLLLDAFLQTVSGAVSHKDAIRMCSDALRRLAKANGIEIDDIYRNINGISFQMASMESAYREKTILKPATRLFTETVEMYKDDRKEYDRILKEARLMTESKQNNEALFMTWLSKKVSPAQLSELYMAFHEIEQQAKKARLISASLYEKKDVALYKKIKADIEQSKVFKFKHKRQMGRINSSLNYLIQYAKEREEAGQFKNKIRPVLKQSIETVEIKSPMHEAPKQEGNIRTVSFEAIPDMAFTKPVAFLYFGERKLENSWRILYADLCNCLIDDYPERFGQMCDESIQGITKVWLVDEKHKNLLAASKALMAGFYIETNRSALDIIKSIRWLLEKCDVDYENVIIEYIKKGDTTTEETQSATSAERKHKCDDKEGFCQWMLNDQHMSEASCRGYVSSIRSAEKYAEEHQYEKSRLLGVSLEDAKDVADALFADEAFIAKNEVQHNRFRAVITKLLCYYGIDWAPMGRKGSSVLRVKEQPTIDAEPYRTVLEKHFPRGYRLESSIEMKKFRRYYEDENGTELTIENDEMESAIRQSGIEHEGRVYAPTTMIDEELKGRLFAYIEKCLSAGKRVLYFEAIFREFEEEFLDHNIYDANMLKTYICNIAGDKYFIGRSYLSAEKMSAADPIEDIRMCVKEHGLPLDVENLCRTLSHIPEDRIKMILGMNLEFVRNSKGEYFHADSFSVSDEELENISAIIHTEISAHEYISGNELYDIIKSKYPYIYERNMMFSVIGWRDALKYKLGNQYSFAGNIISAKGKDLSMSDVFANYAREQGEFTLQELLAFAENIGSTVYFDALYENAARISQEQFVEKDFVSFQVKATDETLDRFCTGFHLAVPGITDFGIFPEASHPWTSFLLEYYLAHHSERYYLMHGGYNRNVVVGAMVKKDKLYADYDELLTDVLADSGVVLQKKTALNYLSDNGYIARRSYANIEVILINARAKRNKKEK